MTKLVSPRDIGKAFAFYGLMQASAPLIFTPLTSFIYREASKVYPNFGPENSFMRGLVGGLWLSPLIVFLAIAILLAIGAFYARREKKDETYLGDKKNLSEGLIPDQ